MKYGGRFEEKIDVETVDSLRVAADNDFVSVLLLWYCGVSPGGTYAWMFSHALEKYLKAYLVKEGAAEISKLRKYAKSGHGLKSIWDDFKKTKQELTTKPKLNQAFDDIIDDLSTLEAGIRYSGYIQWSTDEFVYYFSVLSSYIRYLLVGKKKYRNTLYGLEEHHFIPMNYGTFYKGYGEVIIKKMLHIILEHAGAFTPSGIVNSMNWEDYSISNTAKFESILDCPICSGQEINHTSLKKFYRNIELVQLNTAESDTREDV